MFACAPRLSALGAVLLCCFWATPAAHGQQLPSLPPAPAAPQAPQAPPAPTFSDVPATDALDPGGTDGLDNGYNELAPTSANTFGPDGPEGTVRDPPGRTGRVRVLAGHASVRGQGQTRWLDAASNRPLVPGDVLWVGRTGRAAVQLGTTTLFVGPETTLTVLALDLQVLQLSLARGKLLVHAAAGGGAATTEVMVPAGTVALAEAGDCTIAWSTTSQGAVTVRHGRAQWASAAQQLQVAEGERLRLGLSRAPGYELAPAAPLSRFEQQGLTAAARAEQAETLRYVSQDTVGYDDLDAHGSWSQAPEYGPVWTPRGVPAQWAPYRYGHWAFIAPWGYTWVDDAPWGFAPFHYGRWVHGSWGWGWAPGPMGRRPIYAPHLVSFGRPQGGRGVAWVPLGYGDPFVPAYSVSPMYLQGINVGGSQVFVGVGPGGSSRNCGVPGAITVVPWGVWSGGWGVGTAFGVGTAHAFGPGAFGAPLPPGRQPQVLGYPRGARPAQAVPPLGALPRAAPRLQDIRYGALPGGRAGGPFVPRGLREGQGPAQDARGPGPERRTLPVRPPIGRYEPLPMGHPVQPGVGHPGFPGHMGAPSYHGGGGYGGFSHGLGGGYGSRHGGR